MKIINIVAVISMIMFTFPNCSAFAENGTLVIRWSSLNLDPWQQKRIKLLDYQWKQINNSIRPILIRDQEKFKKMLLNPNISEDEIREQQRQIFIKQEQLRYHALENFLAKRRLLNEKQRELLHDMISK